jgi:signal peptide peptidase SppA
MKLEPGMVYRCQEGGTITGTMIDLQPLAGFSLDLEQYVGLWAVDEVRFGAMLDQVSKMDLAAHITANTGQSQAAAKTSKQKHESANIAIIDIQGTMTKRGSSLSGAGSTVLIRQAIRNAANDPDINGIVLRIDSPGGTVAGTSDLANGVANAAQQKPVWAFVDDVTASAAYWVASQASRIVANNKTAVIGSIGTFMALYDVSGAAAMQGIKAVVIRAGKYKGAGFPGTEISEEQKQIWQETVDKTQAEFTAGVASGRNIPLEQAELLAIGRTWLAEESITLNLIDGIGPFDQVLSDMAAEIQRRNSSKGRSRMSDEQKTPQPATYAEIKVACAGADSDFICQQLEAKATKETAVSAWMSEQQKRLHTANKAKAEAEQKVEEANKAKAEAEQKAKTGKPGVGILGGGKGDGGGGIGNAASEFIKAVEDKMKLYGILKQEAIREVVKENPELHRRYIEEHNVKVGPSTFRGD